MLWPKLCKVLEYVVDQYGPIDGRTRLLKIVYLADRDWAMDHGRPYTEANYYRWNHGPFAREVLDAIDWLDGVEIIERRLSTSSGVLYQYHSGERTRLTNVALDRDYRTVLDRVAAQWSSAPLQALLDHVYRDSTFSKASFGDRLLAS